MLGRNTKIFLTIIFLVCLIWCTGCNKLTKENYQKLDIGMNRSEVSAILGAATDCGDSSFFKNCTWGSKEKSIKVIFVMDKVVYRSSNGLVD